MTQEANVFMDGAPILSGTWYNTKTGDSFTVRDTYFEDNNLYVLSTDGRRFDYNMLQNYVKSDKPLSKEQTPRKQQAQKSLPKEVTSIIDSGSNDMILEDDLAIINGNNRAQTPVTVQKPVAVAPEEPVDEDSMLIRRLLSRGTKPIINVSIKWDKFPTKQMDMLDMMGVDFDKIVDYYIKTAINKDELTADISKKIYDYLHKTLNTEVEELKDKPIQLVDFREEDIIAEKETTEKEPAKPTVKKTVKAAVKKTTNKKTTKK